MALSRIAGSGVSFPLIRLGEKIIVTDKKGELQQSLNLFEKNGYKFVKQDYKKLLSLNPFQSRILEHMYKSNNWLKRHNLPMRRRPFKKEFMMLDEFWKI